MNYFNPHNFYFELPLYTEIQITPENNTQFETLVNDNHKFDAFNPSLGENSTYISRLTTYSNAKTTKDAFGGLRTAQVTCLRTKEVYTYYLQIRTRYIDHEEEEDEVEYYLSKIGQTPSIADLHISQVRDYTKVLPREKLKEFTKAIGLAANGVGIGAFVYLRRIFEHLIEESHKVAATKTGWDEAAFGKARMNEKIGILKDELPSFLVENKSIYSILSVGIHELDEEECKLYFAPLKSSIEEILDDKLAEAERATKRAKRSLDIKVIEGKINKPK